MSHDRPVWQTLLRIGVLAAIAVSAGASGHDVPSHAPIQGRWVAGPISLNAGDVTPASAWCQRFTQNLNQFRTLPFNACSRRVSKKYPEFQRLRWTRIPWNRALVKKVFTVGFYPNSPGYEQGWRHWLEQTRALRRAGKVHLWQTTVDLLGDGQQETLIRLDHSTWGGILIRGGQKVVLPVPPYCRYYDSQLYLLPSPHTALAKTIDHQVRPAAPVWRATATPRQLAQAFNTYGAGYGDVLYDTKSKGYVFLKWQRISLPTKFFRIATGSVMVSTFAAQYRDFIPGCYINWVPTHPAPTKPSSTTPIRLAH